MPNSAPTNRPRTERHKLHAEYDGAEENANVFRAKFEEREGARAIARLEARWASSIQIRRIPCPVRRPR